MSETQLVGIPVKEMSDGASTFAECSLKGRPIPSLTRTVDHVTVLNDMVDYDDPTLLAILYI